MMALVRVKVLSRAVVRGMAKAAKRPIASHSSANGRVIWAKRMPAVAAHCAAGGRSGASSAR